jgi:hypothetical protein
MVSSYFHVLVFPGDNIPDHGLIGRFYAVFLPEGSYSAGALPKTVVGPLKCSLVVSFVVVPSYPDMLLHSNNIGIHRAPSFREGDVREPLIALIGITPRPPRGRGFTTS